MAPSAVGIVKSAISHLRQKSIASHDEYAPPAGPPPTKDSASRQPSPLHQPYVHKVDLPLVPEHRVYNLAAQGWTTLVLAPSPDPRGERLRSATRNLFAAAQVFFDREESYKQQFLCSRMGSEEGYNSIPGEKQFYTIRSTQLLPGELGPAAHAFWAVAGDLLQDMLARIAESVEFAPEALTQLSDGCRRLGTESTATMLRVFRYEGWEDKVVAEPHADLGLLSLVCGQSPGLEVFNAATQTYYPVERRAADLGSMATVLAGRQLQRLTSGVYAPGGHLVRSYSQFADTRVEKSATADAARYRFSIVFVLRGHYPVILEKNMFTSPITGVPAAIDDGMSAKELFVKIKGIHYNINTGIQAREEQKKKLALQRESSAKGIA